MKSLRFDDSKSLRLMNILKYKWIIQDEKIDLNVIIQQMQSYIRAKGVQQIGPLIQYTRVFVNDNKEVDMEIVMMLQCNNYIHNVEQPYSMETLIRVPNALYCRYTGPESSLKFAYDKINLEAFERDIKLADYNYTIFLENNQEGMIVADVFIPRA